MRRRTLKRKITAEKYSENKVHTICVMIVMSYGHVCMGEHDWFTKKLRSSKFVPFCIKKKKKVKTYCNTRHPTKDQVKKYKRKMGQWINDNKSVYIFENLAYNLIRYNNLGVIKADEFRKNLGISNNQSTKRERHNSERKYGEAV